MIKIVATQNVSSENAERFEDLARELVEKSRAEAGNVDYSCNKGLKDPTLYAFIEIWADQAAVQSHMASEHFTRISAQLGELAENGTISLFTEI